MFFILVAIAIVATASAVYVFFFLPHGLSSAETAGRLESIYSRTMGILDLMSDDMGSLISRNITVTIFTSRMVDLKNDMTSLGTELTEMKAVAYPTYTQSIDLLDRGLQSYIDALDYAFNLNFNQTSQSLQQGTEYVNRSKNALPKA